MPNPNDRIILACFNIRKHLLSITDFKPRNDEISCFHGMRVLSLLIIVAIHSFLTKAYSLDPQSEIYENLSKGKKLIQLQIATVVVDTFFIIGAILMTRSVFKDLRR